MNLQLPLRNLALALLAATITLPAFAETPEEKGLALAVEADKRDENWGDSQSTLEMILRNRNGDESRREMRSKSLEVANDGDKSLIIFDHPKDVRGTALLTFSHKDGADDQWLYLPALKRVKRIASNNKSGPFMGSEFAYEDISSQEVEKYTYKYLRDETYEGQDVYVTERYPVDPKSGYTKQVVWTDKAEFRVLKVDYYDRKQSLLKTLTFHEYEKFQDKFWRTHRMEMINHQTGKSTTLKFADISFNNGLDEADFDQASLARAR